MIHTRSLHQGNAAAIDRLIAPSRERFCDDPDRAVRAFLQTSPPAPDASRHQILQAATRLMWCNVPCTEIATRFGRSYTALTNAFHGTPAMPIMDVKKAIAATVSQVGCERIAQGLAQRKRPSLAQYYDEWRAASGRACHGPYTIENYERVATALLSDVPSRDLAAHVSLSPFTAARIASIVRPAVLRELSRQAENDLHHYA